MFDPPKYIRNSFGISFQRQPDIRRNANKFEDILQEHYFQPQIIPVPDDLAPEVPRIIFGSQHGFSQIIVSQINVTLNVEYSLDWQEDISKGKKYLMDRVPILFKLLEIFEEANPHFCGLVTLVRLSAKAEFDEDTVLNSMTSFLHGNTSTEGLHDILLKTTTIVSGQFFNNITLKNYRLWKTEGRQDVLQRLSRGEVFEHGIEIVGDFNDRYRFNENKGYFSSQDMVEKIIGEALSEMHMAIKKIKGVRS